jgi:CHAT domain-containing protein
MSKTQTILIVILCIGIVGISYGILTNKDNVVGVEKDVKIREVNAFIHDFLFANITGDIFQDQYKGLDEQDLNFFLHLKKGAYLLEKEDYQEAWNNWDLCLNSVVFNDYKAEVYFTMGTVLGERDGFTSYVLLQKALEITRSSERKNIALQYCCLNALIKLLVSQAEDGTGFQQLDKIVQQYSLDAHCLLSDHSFPYKERNASTSIYRIAAESLYWLGNDSLANAYVEHLLDHKQNFDKPELTQSYVSIMKGIQNYVHEDFQASETCFKSAISKIGDSTSYLSYDLELPYAYLGIIFMQQKRYAEAVDYMERSIKTLQRGYYNHIDEPLKLISSDDMRGKCNTYNIILCYIRLQHFYKEALRNDENFVEVSHVIALINYTKQLIKLWFLNAADEETLLRSTKLIKQCNSNAIDLIWENQHNFTKPDDCIFGYQTEASSFYFNYLKELRKRENKSGEYKKIMQLTLELASVQKNKDQLKDENIRKKISLLKFKSRVWDTKRQELKDLVYHEVVPSNITEGHAVVKYFVAYSKLYISYFTSKGNGIKRVECNHLASETKDFKRAVKTKATLGSECQYFYQLLVKPIEKELEGASCLTILSDESLNGITFEILKDEKGNLLIEKMAIKYAFSAKELTHKSRPQLKKILAMAPGFENNNAFIIDNFTRDAVEASSFIEGDSFSDFYLSSIPCSTEEVEAIGKLFNDKKIDSEVFIREKATKTNLIDHMHSQTIVHIATHGINNDAYDSGLFFSLNDQDNGFLSLQELYKQSIQADLVVLSACKTGTGKVVEGEGVLALPRGFRYAGASNVIASLWKVHDEKTKDLMVAFYTHLLEENVSYAEALRRAKLDCITNGFLPVDWAGFVIIGN